MDDDAKWEEIAEDAIRAAEKVKCPLTEFARGLKIVEQTVRDRRVMAEAEVEKQQPSLDL